MSRVLFIVIFFLALPYGAYRTAWFYIDQYFRAKGVPYPSEYFAVATGLGAAFCVLGLSFFIQQFLLVKRRTKS